MAYLLAIESSCDETAVAVFKDQYLQSSVIATQPEHEQFGGVVPELASRLHQQTIVKVTEDALLQAGITKSDLDAIAFTYGPGLLGSLLVGASFAKGIAGALSLPLIAVHHLEAHVLAHFIEPPYPEFPFVCLTVSGGHTQLIWMESPLTYTIIGNTHDDAAGEAFDKAARLLGLPYPGGAWIDKHAKLGDPLKYTFPRPMPEGLDFSFSGLKTAFLYFLKTHLKTNPDFIAQELPHICASYQNALVKILLNKLSAATSEYPTKGLALAGGVSANSQLRKEFEILCNELGLPGFTLPLAYCTDNAAMIGMAAWFKWKENQFVDLSISPDPSGNAIKTSDV
jgi:N6-L-threonylcarbamoyladenine synthase